MNYDYLSTDYPQYGISQTPYGGVCYTKTTDYLDQALYREERDPMLTEFVSNNLEVSKGLKALENKTQGRQQLNTAVQQKQPRSIIGHGAPSQLFKVKAKRRGSYI